MKSILNKPQILLWILIPVILLLGFLAPDETLVINFHDSYYVIALIHLAEFVSILFGITGLGYWIILKVNRKLINVLTLTHIIITIGGSAILLLAPYFFSDDITETTFFKFDNLIEQNMMNLFALLLIVIGLIIFIINILQSLFRRKETMVKNK
ncbi:MULTISPECIES: hypothetical protein [Maribacter]|uniref:hypothetical protein n=1 Tax=Maribacter TaxID=252356 RepID=UPI00047B5E3C|nr:MULTISPECIES: hypothetical protein [Maribacter]